MAYEIDPGAGVLEEVQRIAGEQTDDALADLLDPGEDIQTAIHDCRKRCKKIRGLVRLVRPALGDHYPRANTTFRDAARRVSDLRDAHAQLASFDDLVEVRRDQLPSAAVTAVRRELAERSVEASRRALDGTAMAAAAELLRDGRDLIGRWQLDEDGFDAVAGGLEKTYDRGRDALDDASGSSSAEDFHELRKRAKYTWYHVRLLAPTAPSVLEPLGRRMHDLSDALGSEHDLAIMGPLLRSLADRLPDPDQLDPLMVVVDGQRADLQRRAIRLGARLYAEKPTALVERFGSYWRAWHDHGEELAAGELAATA